MNDQAPAAFDFAAGWRWAAPAASIPITAPDLVEARRISRSMHAAGVLGLLVAAADAAVTAVEAFVVGVSAATCGSSVAAVFAATLGVILLLCGRTFRRIAGAGAGDGGVLLSEGITRLRGYLVVKAVAFGAVLALTCCLLGTVIGVGTIMAAANGLPR